MSRILTIPEAVALASVIEWCQSGAQLAWLDDCGDVAHGTARSIGNDRGGFLAVGEDVRDAHLRITTARGWEWFVPMADVLARHHAGTMVREQVPA